MTKKHRYFTEEQLDVFRKNLETKRQEANDELKYCREELEEGLSSASGGSSTYSFHMADQGTDAQEREKTFMFASRQSSFLQTIEAAIDRLAAGTYGICIQCGGPIHEVRLKVVPTAKLCRNCKPEE
jgi:DnaK suppressor protein